MASNPLINAVSGFDLTNVFQDLYLVPSDKSRAGIDAATFNNYSSANVTITIRLIQDGGAGDVFDELVTAETIRAGKSYLAPPIIGQSLGLGGILQVKVSANDSVNANITVTEIDA